MHLAGGLSYPEERAAFERGSHPSVEDRLRGAVVEFMGIARVFLPRPRWRGGNVSRRWRADFFRRADSIFLPFHSDKP